MISISRWRQERFFAFLGSNGSGKTTTLRCLLGIYAPDQGKLLINGETYSPNINHLIGYLPEERGLYTKAKLIDIFKYFGKLRGLHGKDLETRVDNYLERVGLSEHKYKKVSAA